VPRQEATRSTAERSSGRILVVEPNPTGHRLVYVRLIVEHARALGRDVRVALGRDADRTPEYALHLAGLDLGPTLTASSKDLAELRALASSSHADLVVVPDGDAVALTLGRGGRWDSPATLSVLVMRGTAQPSKRPMLNLPRRLARRALLLAASARPNVRVHVLATGWRPPRSLIPTAPDPISFSASSNDRLQLRERLGLNPDRYWFGVLGAIDERKNAEMVARAVLASPSRRQGFIVAGPIRESVLRNLNALAPRFSAAGIELRLVDRVLSQHELDEFVLACDCVVIAYATEFPSGIFGKALLAGTRTITAGSRWLRADSRQVPDHAEWVPLDVKSLSGAMARALDSDRPEPYELPSPYAFVGKLL
jgi:hypothetical protein